MALPSTGAISLSQVNTELGKTSTAVITMGDSGVRGLAGKPTGTISMADLRGKSSFTAPAVTWRGMTMYDPDQNLMATVRFFKDGRVLAYPEVDFSQALASSRWYEATPGYVAPNRVFKINVQPIHNWVSTEPSSEVLMEFPNDQYMDVTITLKAGEPYGSASIRIQEVADTDNFKYGEFIYDSV